MVTVYEPSRKGTRKESLRFVAYLLERAMIPLHAILVLVAALSAISSAGVLVSAMPTLDAWAIAWWRMLGTAILLSPLLRRLPRSEWSRVGVAGIFPRTSFRSLVHVIAADPRDAFHAFGDFGTDLGWACRVVISEKSTA